MREVDRHEEVCECERVRVLDREEDDKTDEGERVEGGDREKEEESEERGRRDEGPEVRSKYLMFEALLVYEA